MSPADRDGGGTGGPKRWKNAARPGDVFDPAAANLEMADKLRRNGLRKKARASGLELRHSDYGYTLIDAERNRVGGRNDLTLDEVAAHLDK
jgi:hypothetical protein